MYRRSVRRARISTISLSMTWLSPGILHWTRQLRITRFSSSKSQSDARRYNWRFLYWKQVSHSSANCTLRLLNAVVIIVIWIRSSHTKPLVPAFAGEWNEKMYHSTKSDIIHCIEKEAEAVSHGATETDTQQQHDCVVPEGGQLIHQLDARWTGTVEQFTQKLFLKHL